MKNPCSRNLEKLLSETILIAISLICDSRKKKNLLPNDFELRKNILLRNLRNLKIALSY